MLPEEIKKKCEAFREQNDEFEKYHKPAVISGIIFGMMLFPFLYVALELPENIPYQIELSYGVGIITLSALVVGSVFAAIGRKYKLDQTSLSAMYGYRAFQSIQEYKEGAKLYPKLKRAKKYLKLMKDEIIQDWSSIVESNSIISNRIEPIKIFVKRIEKIPSAVDNESHLTVFQQTLLALIEFVLDKKNNNFESMTKKLERFVPPEIEIEIEESESVLKKYPIMKLIWIPIIVGIGLFFLFDHLDPQSKQTSSVGAISISVVILLSILFRKSIKIKE